jgi:3-phenylpropionate/trans-cinnamate dioxygenase ferredoxin reductase subunit
MSCNLVINGRPVRANVGETLIDAGLNSWIAIPHDCCSGQCETCRVTVVGGRVDARGTDDKGTVLACQAQVIGDAEIAYEEIPATAKRAGVVTDITRVTPDTFEVGVELATPMQYRPGQYLGVKFSGLPVRELSPTLRLDGSATPNELVFHIRRYPGGLVSTQIGATIRVGHRVQVRGPFGSAFLREGYGPLVLVAGGTGWAPIWSIANAARRTQPGRELIVIAGARDSESIYMRRSLDWLIDDGVRDVIATAEVGAIDPVLPGRPTLYLPSLGPEDTVYVAGPPGLVDTVRAKARAAAARCYADPFLPSVQTPSFIDRMMAMLLRRPGAEAPALTVHTRPPGERARPEPVPAPATARPAAQPARSRKQP